MIDTILPVDGNPIARIDCDFCNFDFRQFLQSFDRCQQVIITHRERIWLSPCQPLIRILLQCRNLFGICFNFWNGAINFDSSIWTIAQILNDCNGFAILRVAAIVAIIARAHVRIEINRIGSIESDIEKWRTSFAIWCRMFTTVFGIFVKIRRLETFGIIEKIEKVVECFVQNSVVWKRLVPPCKFCIWRQIVGKHSEDQC